MIALIAWLGRRLLAGVRSTGALALVLARTALHAPSVDPREVLRNVAAFGYRSLPLALGVATLIGATVVLQTSLYVERFGVRTFLGWAAGYAVLWEFGPLLLGLMMAARVGARNAAELASLSVGGQLEGLRGISLDPFAILVAPRVIASGLAVALLAPVAFLVAIVWELTAAFLMLGLPWRVFLVSFSDLLSAKDLLGGCIKATVFGFAISLVSTAVGLRAEGGARAVGRAAAASVVWCCAAIFSLDFALTALLGAVME